MNTPTPEEVQCDDALRMLSRSLDGDLTRAETRQLYLHLASCESCRVRMGQMAALASDLEELNASMPASHWVPLSPKKSCKQCAMSSRSSQPRLLLAHRVSADAFSRV